MTRADRYCGPRLEISAPSNPRTSSAGIGVSPVEVLTTSWSGPLATTAPASARLEVLELGHLAPVHAEAVEELVEEGLRLLALAPLAIPQRAANRIRLKRI